MATTEVTKPTVTYFNLPLRAEVIRLILEEAGVDYDYVPVTNWAEQKKNPKLAFGQVPLYEEPGFSLVQSGAIVRYLAGKHGFSGSNGQEAAQIDAIAQGVVDFSSTFITWKWRTEASKKEAATQAILQETLPTQLGYFSALLEKNGNNGFFVGHKLSYADLAVFVALLLFQEVPGATDVISKISTIAKFQQGLANRDRIKAYYERNVYAKN